MNALTKATVPVLNRNWPTINVRTPQEAFCMMATVSQRKADRLPHEARLNLLSRPRGPKELPAIAFIRNSHGIADWKLFVAESSREWGNREGGLGKTRSPQRKCV